MGEPSHGDSGHWELPGLPLPHCLLGSPKTLRTRVVSAVSAITSSCLGRTTPALWLVSFMTVGCSGGLRPPPPFPVTAGHHARDEAGLWRSRSHPGSLQSRRQAGQRRSGFSPSGLQLSRARLLRRANLGLAEGCLKVAAMAAECGEVLHSCCCSGI